MWPSLALFSAYWVVHSRRFERHTWPETIATLFLQLGVLAALGWIFPGWVWKSVLLLYLTLPWWAAPFLTWRERRFPAEFDLRQVDNAAVPAHLRPALEKPVRELAAAGLQTVGIFCSPEAADTSEAVVVAESEDGHELLSASVMQVVTGGGTETEARRTATTVVCAMRFADGSRLVVNNVDEGLAAVPPDTRTERLPGVNDPVRLLAFARAYRARFFPGKHPVPVRGGESLWEFMRSRYQRHWKAQVNAGHMRVLPDGSYGYTLRGALVLSLLFAPPFRQIAGLRLRLRERKLMREMGMPLPPASPGPWWFGRLDLQGAAAIAIALLMLLPVPALPRPAFPSLQPAASVATSLVPTARPYRLPDGFAVPADFPGAVRALEGLAGARAVPLRVEDAYTGEMHIIEGVEVPFAADQTDSLLARAAPLFRARGFLLFRHGQTFGSGGEPEQVALYPRDDAFEVMKLVGTNGINYGIDSDSVVAWLDGLYARHPFAIVGISHDAVEGVFLPPPDEEQARKLAREFNRFCPDIVTQGVGTTRALADELQRTGTLYCWWD